MKLTKRTIEILKSFSSINNRIKFKPGNIVRSLSANKTSMASAVVEETFESEFALHNLSGFLNTLNVYGKDPEITFGEKYLTITEADGAHPSRIFYCPANLVQYPSKEIELPSVEVTCQLTGEDLKKAQRIGGAIGCPDLVFRTKDGQIELAVTDTSVSESNDATLMKLGSANGAEFNLIFRLEYLTNLLNDDYSVEVNSRPFAKFNGNGISYFIAGEPTSSYKG